MPDYTKVPSSLKASHRWLVWKYGEKPNAKGKKPKLPVDLQSGRCVDKQNAACYSFDAVVQAHGYEGIGFLPIHPHIGVDIDSCIVDDQLSNFAIEVIKHCNSYTEISPSSKGIRIWVKGNAPKAPQDNVRNPLGTNRLVIKDALLEIYPDAPNANYLTVTGNAVEGSPEEVRELSDAEIKQLYAFAAKATAPTPSQPAPAGTEAPKAGFTRLQRYTMLTMGDWQRLHPSQSEADLEFCAYLAEAHDNDPALIDRDFRKAKLFRDKWDHLRGADTYGNNTIKMAIERNKSQKRPAGKAPLAPLVKISSRDLLRKDIVQREALLVTKGTRSPVIFKQSLNQIFAWRSTGKTMIALGLSGAMAKGEEFLAWQATRPVKVLYVEGEMPAGQMQERCRSLVGDIDNFELITLDLQSDNYIPALSDATGRTLIEEALGDTEVLVLDSVSTLVKIATNEEENWLEFLEWLMKLRSKGLAVIVLQHAGKTGTQRGHSRSEDNLDLSIHLKNPEGYERSEGLHAELEFDKVRGYIPDGDGIDIRLENGQWLWNFKQTEAQDKVTAFIRQNPGMSDREVAKKLGISHTTVGKARRHMHEKEVMLDLNLETEPPKNEDPDF